LNVAIEWKLRWPSEFANPRKTGPVASRPTKSWPFAASSTCSTMASAAGNGSPRVSLDESTPSGSSRCGSSASCGSTSRSPATAALAALASAFVSPVSASKCDACREPWISRISA
jgi:hypothetical protein